MSISKILIRLDQNLHIALKLLAIEKSITLNQLCLDLIQKSMIENENNLDHILKTFDEHGLILVLETKGYLADYVLLIENHLPLPEQLQNSFLEIIQILHFPETENPPNSMWIEIAKNHKIKWSQSKEVENRIEKKLNDWKELW